MLSHHAGDYWLGKGEAQWKRNPGVGNAQLRSRMKFHDSLDSDHMLDLSIPTKTYGNFENFVY